MVSRSIVLLLVFLLVSCKQPALHGASDFPAVLLHPTPQSQAELTQVVSEALSGAKVTLADNALTQTSLLIIERSKQGNFNNDRVMGRDLSTPDQFRLVVNNGKCFLIYQKNANRFLLAKSSCTKN